MNHVRLPLVVLASLLSITPPAPAGGPGASINALVADHAAKNPKAVVGLSVVDLRDGTKLASLNETRLCTPASNLKVFTSIFALTTLGGEAKFTTTAWLEGDALYVTGQFDPTLGDPNLADAAQISVYAELDRWAQALKTATDGKGVRRLLLACGTPGTGYRHEDWSPAQYDSWYEAPVAALNFQNNCIDVSFQVVSGVRQTVVSPTGQFFHVNDQTRAGGKTAWQLKLSDNDATWTLTGTVSRSSTEPRHVPVNDPALFLGRVLADRIVRAGMPAPASLAVVSPTDKPASAKAIASTVTPLATVMARANKRSLNMAAECMLLRTGDGTWAGSVRTMESVLTSTYHLPAGSMDLRDGSGLSKHNRVTPAAMTTLLAGVLERKDAKIFVESLPRAGVDGTLQSRFKGKDKAVLGRIVAKTGFINNVHGLSGYVADKDGRLCVAFSILSNGPDSGARDLLEGVTTALVKWLDAK
ncbi:MAG: D-alanyl-D-alanine carboxypeptidase/D-alanyl-D-alanine-endopeptidase [Planctomycetota bacterium]|nr:D-alanyl-D-alanine carboxypeptidase/D-alanyl-D-alanine-endopeptidase [Planctomycetota bacterium]